ncbi:hypothetical protein ACJRO7_023109 [Eucalyptus globulus]|uniref:Uncharacterized protein n=1 Tax=Eucalyptus globulus TaxID=34317 RepID=A0ABD3K335_EUCGL
MEPTYLSATTIAYLTHILLITQPTHINKKGTRQMSHANPRSSVLKQNLRASVGSAKAQVKAMSLGPAALDASKSEAGKSAMSANERSVAAEEPLRTVLYLSFWGPYT